MNSEGWELVHRAYETIRAGDAKRVDLEHEGLEISVYKAGTIIRVDIKGI